MHSSIKKKTNFSLKARHLYKQKQSSKISIRIKIHRKHNFNLLTQINDYCGANNKSLQNYKILWWKINMRRVSQILTRLFKVKQWMYPNNKLNQSNKHSEFLKLWGHSGCLWKVRGKVELKFVNKYTCLRKLCLNVMMRRVLQVNWIR